MTTQAPAVLIKPTHYLNLTILLSRKNIASWWLQPCSFLQQVEKGEDKEIIRIAISEVLKPWRQGKMINPN